MGGAWERMIRSVRQILRAILKEQVVSDKVLQTAMAEVMQIWNSRLLTRNSYSRMDEDPLTPNHLLHDLTQACLLVYSTKIIDAVREVGNKPSISLTSFGADG